MLAGCGSGPDRHFEAALKAFSDKDFEKAESSARKVLAVQPDYVPAYLLLARAASAREDEQSAEINYRNAFDTMKGREFKLRSEDVRAAQSGLKIYWQEAAFYLADAEFKHMNYSRTDIYYDTVIADSGSSEWRRKAQDSKAAVREFAQNRNRFEMLRAQNIKKPNDPRIQADMSAILMEMSSGLARLGKMKSVAEQVGIAAKFREQARTALAELHQVSPEIQLRETEALLDYTESQENLMRGKHEEAAEKAMQACEKEPGNGKYRFTVASILAVLATRNNDPAYRLDDRLEYARKAVELEPGFWRYLTAYAGLLRDKGQINEAYSYLLKAREAAKAPEDLAQIDGALAMIEKERGGAK
jgi:Tfp pilus assembly protein PilF